MPLTFNGTNITKVTYNGTALDKIIFNGTTVWESWVLKTGNLYVMTSNSAPSPFVASRTNNNMGTAHGQPYQALNNGNSNLFGCWVTNSGGYTQVNLAFNQTKKIRISKVAYAYDVTGIATWGGGTFYIDVFNGSSWVQVFTQGFSTSGVRSGTVNVLSSYPTMEATNIRSRMVYGSGAEAHTYYIRKVQVTEWYEKATS